MAKTEIIYPKNVRAKVAIDFTLDKYSAPRTKLKSWELFWTYQPIYLKTGSNWLNWQCFLAGSSKTAPMILLFSIVMGAEYSSYMKSIATFAFTFFWYIISVLASVERQISRKKFRFRRFRIRENM